MKAPPHPLQASRLAALHAYEVLDTDRESQFDEIVTLASAICETPISVVNLIDADRQWFKAEVGLGLRETPLDTSICAHAILEQDFVEIPDLLQDPRLADNPLCAGDGGLRFYAGALLVGSDGLPVGTLCVLDVRPRTLTPLQREALRVLGRQVITQLELRKALRNARMLRQEVDHRVKNSLQTLSSLARLQRRETEAPEAIAALDMMSNRLDAVATLHQILSETDAGASVDLGLYVGRLCDHLSRLLPGNVVLNHPADSVTVASEQAVSVGTLVNELVANSLKHAFPDGRRGRIDLTLIENPDGVVEVTYADDGVGRARARPREGALGIKIAEVACADLGCTLVLGDEAPGMSARFAFRPRLRG